MRQGQPARINQRSALKISRKGNLRCGAFSVINVKYGAQNSHSSSLTSLGYAFRSFAIPSVMPGCIYFVQTIFTKKFLTSSNQSPEPTPNGHRGSAVAVHVTN